MKKEYCWQRKEKLEATMSEGPKLYTNKPKKGKLSYHFCISRKQSFLFLFLKNIYKQVISQLPSRMRDFCIWLLIDCLWFLQTAHLKQFQEQQQKAKDFYSPSSSSSSMETQSSAPPPQQPPKESFARRYKFLWPMLLAVNLAVGGPFLSLIPQLCEISSSFFFLFYF